MFCSSVPKGFQCTTVPKRPDSPPKSRVHPTSPNTPCRDRQPRALLNLIPPALPHVPSGCFPSFLYIVKARAWCTTSSHPLTSELMGRHTSPLTPKHSEGSYEVQVLPQSVITKPGRMTLTNSR